MSEDLKKSIIRQDGTIKSFDEITISTKTVIGISNLKIDLNKFFDYMPITDYTPVEKKRGRKRKIQIVSNINKLPVGSIICIQKKKDLRGVCLKKKNASSRTDDKDYFLHSISLVIMIEDNKTINMKVSSNGKLQITGCKNDNHYITAVVSVFNTMKEVEKWTNEKLFEMNGEHLEVVFNTVMQNMDFNIGFRIDRHRLDKFIMKNTDYTSVFECSLSTGVNIKVRTNPNSTPTILKIVYDNKDVARSYISFNEYKTLLDKKKEVKKDKHHTFLVFASGSIIMSSRGYEMEEVYNDLVNILTENRDQFEDKNYTPQEWLSDVDDDDI